MSTEDMDIGKIVEDIEGMENAENVEDTKPEQETSKEEAAAIEQALSFKSPDDLLGHKLKYKTDRGKEVEEDIKTILTRAGAGYHFAQKMGEYNNLMNEYNSNLKPQYEEAMKLKEKYGKFEEYAKENPDWYDHWTKAYEQRGSYNIDGVEDSGVNDSEHMRNMFKEMLAQELGPVREFMQSRQTEDSQAKITAEDQALDAEIVKTRESFPNIDFDRTDPETGMSLEHQVLDFMYKSGIKDFSAGFKAYYHDNLVKMQVEQAQERAQKDAAERKKNGIIGISTTPQKSARPSNHSQKNYDQLMELALKDPEIFGVG